MSLFRPRKPSKAGAQMSIWEMLFNGNGLFGNDSNGKWEYKSGVYFYRPNFPSSSGGGKGVGGGGFDIYDQTKDYAAGETFFVPLPTTIAGIAVAAGLYGVPAAGTNSVGTFSGGVPANPTGNAVPQAPLPAITTAPNDKYYSILISGTCSVL